MNGRIALAFAVIGVACLANGQTTAPPPNAKDVPVPSRPTVPAGGQDQSLVSGTLSADDAVRIAIEKQPTLEAVRQAVTAAEGRVKQLRARLLPQVGVAGTYSTSHFVGDEPDRLDLLLAQGYGASAMVTQLVFDANHSSDLVRQQKALKTVAIHDLARAKADLALQALESYYLVGEAHRLVGVNERNVANRDSQLQLARSRFNSGLGGADDVLTAQTAKGDAVISLVQARTTEDAAKVLLLQTLGLDPQTPVAVGEDGARSVTIDRFDDFVAKSIDRRPEVLRAKASIDAAKFGARAAKTTSAPTLSGNVVFGTNDPGFPYGGGGYALNFVLSVPLYDGGLTAGAVQTAQAVVKSAESDLKTAQLQVRTDVSQAYLAVRGAEQQDEAAKINVVNAKESVRIAEGRYKSGVGLFLDIINAQAALLTAETASESAQAEVYRQRATLQHAAGLLTPMN